MFSHISELPLYIPYTLDDRKKVELFSCKEVRILEVVQDVMEFREIGRKEMEVGGGNLIGGTERGEGETCEHVIDGESCFRGAMIALEGK